MEEHFKALPGVAVSISGPGGVVVRTADSSGKVVFEDVAPGSYQVSARLQGHREERSPSQEGPTTVLAGGCASATIDMVPEGSVRGTLLYFDGKAAPRVRLGLAKVEEPGSDRRTRSAEATTDADGRFVFSDVSPGTYLLGANIEPWSAAIVPREWYPAGRNKAGASPIRVEEGTPVENLVMTLPDFGPLRNVRLCMVDQSGKPLPGAVVAFPPAEREEEETVVLDGPRNADASGCVLLTGYSTVTYRLGVVHRAWQAPSESTLSSDTVTIPPGEGPVERVLVLKPLTAR